ncbi:MAG: hypothetical protein JNJ55_10645, partial [Betaproteobacteria bacterium]|nr:hypothetical protein [Betaproteobacteria bacterium]
MTPGRSCPLHYRYPARVFQRAADLNAETIFVIGGLYGNLASLDEIERMAACEKVKPLLVFNGDFHWFDAEPTLFGEINARVLPHVALRGNVETELDGSSGDAGCGCAYPEEVDEADVARSNRIMARLVETARAFPSDVERLAKLPMHAVAEIAGQRIGIVHGDAESLAGWRFSHAALHETSNQEWLMQVCAEANLAGFASTHTCLPAFRRFDNNGKRAFVANNGAAGMPNFSFTQYGLLTRLSAHPPAEGNSQFGFKVGELFVDALPIHYDAAAFEEQFLRDWPPGSPAHESYFKRITEGPPYGPPHALGLV